VHATTIDSAAYLEKGIQSLAQLPPFSPILNKLMASLASEDVSVAELAGWIEKDAVMTGHVMRLVNSVAFGCRGTVSSVRHAIAILGLIKLRNTVLGISVCRMWTQLRTPNGWSTSRFNQHAAATGIMADLIVQYTPVDYGEGAFVAGLLHNIGMLVIALGLSPQYLEIQEMIQAGLLSPDECELAVLGLRHSDYSAATLEKWNLPIPIQTAVKFHHNPGDSPEDASSVITLSRVLNASDAIVQLMGISIMPGSEKTPPQDPTPLLEELGLGAKAEKILDNFHLDYEVIKGVF
jgi:HD-like signal output (HDOD) protein